MKRHQIRTTTLLSLILTLAIVTSGFTGAKCSPTQKAVVDISLASLTRILTRANNSTLNDILAGVSAFQSNPSADNYQKALASFDAVLARHTTLSPGVLEVAQLGRDIFARLTVGRAEGAMSDEPLTAAAKQELEDKFRRLEKKVDKLSK
ncbi:MAG: hypothetical protein QOH63_1961 [Acidobacteriota bacterium]|jgi:hypothetical protein|nr:hypothetical protein [Acidobacteriota bacterium]